MNFVVIQLINLLHDFHSSVFGVTVWEENQHFFSLNQKLFQFIDYWIYLVGSCIEVIPIFLCHAILNEDLLNMLQASSHVGTHAMESVHSKILYTLFEVIKVIQAFLFVKK